MQQQTTTRDHLLAAAQQVVIAGGANALTLDAVARAARVSKGGLLYHFPNKEALIVGMIDLLCVAFEAALAQALADDGQAGSGRFVRAYVTATFAPNREALELSAALLAAAANNPGLVAPFQERMAGWQAQIEHDGLDPALATAIRLAADGLWFADLGGFATPTGQQRQQVLDTLLALTKGTHQ